MAIVHAATFTAGDDLNINLASGFIHSIDHRFAILRHRLALVLFS
jgi:hypothetical protein